MMSWANCGWEILALRYCLWASSRFLLSTGEAIIAPNLVFFDPDLRLCSGRHSLELRLGVQEALVNAGKSSKWSVFFIGEGLVSSITCALLTHLLAQSLNRALHWSLLCNKLSVLDRWVMISNLCNTFACIECRWEAVLCDAFAESMYALFGFKLKRLVAFRRRLRYNIDLRFGFSMSLTVSSHHFLNTVFRIGLNLV